MKCVPATRNTVHMSEATVCTVLEDQALQFFLFRIILEVK